MTQIAKGSAEAATSKPSQSSIQTIAGMKNMSLNSTTAPKVPDGQSGNIPANAEGLSKSKTELPDTIYNQLEDTIGALHELKCMSSIASVLVAEWLASSRGRKDDNGCYVLRFSPGLLEQLIFAANDVDHRAIQAHGQMIKLMEGVQ